MYVSQQAELLQIQSPCLTFDYPLWLKAVDIVHPSKLNIVCRLGPFHTTMSYLGSIGSLMNGSGLSYGLSVVYAENSSIHMMVDEAVKRAIRAQFLTDLASHILPLSEFLASQPLQFELLTQAPGTFCTADMDDLAASYGDIHNHRTTISDLAGSPSLLKLKNLLAQHSSINSR